jgi:hypothetical protein
MDVERIIGEIEQLQEMFEAPDIRPLSRIMALKPSMIEAQTQDARRTDPDSAYHTTVVKGRFTPDAWIQLAVSSAVLIALGLGIVWVVLLWS